MSEFAEDDLDRPGYPRTQEEWDGTVDRIVTAAAAAAPAGSTGEAEWCPRCEGEGKCDCPTAAQRYDLVWLGRVLGDAEMGPDPTGEWMRYDDHARLLAERDEALAAARGDEHLFERIESLGEKVRPLLREKQGDRTLLEVFEDWTDEAITDLAAARAEVDRLRGEVRELVDAAARHRQETHKDGDTDMARALADGNLYFVADAARARLEGK